VVVVVWFVDVAVTVTVTVGEEKRTDSSIGWWGVRMLPLPSSAPDSVHLEV